MLRAGSLVLALSAASFARTAAAQQCTLDVARGTLINTHPDAVTVAAFGDDLLVANTIAPASPSGSPPGTPRGEWAQLAPGFTAAPVWQEPPSTLRGDGVGIVTAAAADGRGLATVTLAYRYGVGGPGRGVVTFAPLGRAAVSVDFPWAASEIVAAGRGDRRLLAVLGRDVRRGPQSAVLVYSQAIGPRRNHRENLTAGHPDWEARQPNDALSHVPRAPAVAVGPGESAIAYVNDGELNVQRFEANGDRPEAPRTVARDPASTAYPYSALGAPTLAFLAHRVFVVWAQRSSPTAPYQLFWTSWDMSESESPSPPQAIDTGGRSAFAPSIAIDGRRITLAWMEGDTRTGVVRLASTRDSLEHITDHVASISTPGVNARDPEVAMSATRTWVVWQEFPAGRSGELRAATAQCQ